MCEEPEISEKKLNFDPFNLETDYQSHILSQKKQNSFNSFYKYLKNLLFSLRYILSIILIITRFRDILILKDLN